MGNIFEKKAQKRILMQGLDYSGKTTILYQLKLGEAFVTIPRHIGGVNIETIQHKNISMTWWDVGAREKIGDYMTSCKTAISKYYPNTDALVFVIDSNDKERIDEVKEDIQMALGDKELKGSLFLFYANKQDLVNTYTVKELIDILELNRITTHSWHIQPCCARIGDGLYEGLDWLVTGFMGSDQDIQKEINSPHRSFIQHILPV